jgi:hypothetical protein
LRTCFTNQANEATGEKNDSCDSSVFPGFVDDGDECDDCVAFVAGIVDAGEEYDDCVDISGFVDIPSPLERLQRFDNSNTFHPYAADACRMNNDASRN